MSVDERIRLLLSAQVALLGMITSNVRGVACRLDQNTIFVTTVFDGSANEEDVERCEVVASEIVANFLNQNIETIILSYKMPLLMKELDVGEWVYMRYEH